MNGPKIARAGALSLMSLLVIAACDDSPTEPPAQPVPYQGALEGVGEFTSVTGSVALEAGESALEVAISLENAPEVDEEGFPWIFREGTCEEPGDEVGALADYPGIVLDGDGAWEGSLTFVPDDLDTLILDVRRSSGEPETRIACGEVEPVED